MLKPENIEIFVATYNRAEYLKQALESIENQTVTGLSITVLDNASTDNTEETVAHFKGIKYIKALENGGGIANFKRAQDLALAKYIMYFHDDDLLHPKYIETVLSVLNSFENLSFVASCFTWFKDNNIPDFSKTLGLSNEHLLLQRDFLFANSLLMVRFSSCICSFVYRNDLFKQINWDIDLYGKLNDWPEAVRLSQKGTCAVIIDQNSVYCREHTGRDSSNDNTGITTKQLYNWANYFFSIMQTNKQSKNFYNRKIPIVLEHQYKFFVSENEKKKSPFNDIIEQMFKNSILSNQGRMFALRKKNVFFRILTLRLKLVPHPDISQYIHKAKK